MRIDDSTIKRFWGKVDKNKECWEWIGPCNPGGYGNFGLGGKTVSAHRVAWRIARGEIPDQLWVLHRCDNRRCVNPDHLFLGTRTDNVRDMGAKGRRRSDDCLPKGTDCSWAKLTEEQIDRIRQSDLPQKVLAVELGVSQALISMIRTRKRWGWKE